MGLTRLLALVRKEFLALFRDPNSRMILIAPPVLQLLVFSYPAPLSISRHPRTAGRRKKRRSA